MPEYRIQEALSFSITDFGSGPIPLSGDEIRDQKRNMVAPTTLQMARFAIALVRYLQAPAVRRPRGVPGYQFSVISRIFNTIDNEQRNGRSFPL